MAFRAAPRNSSRATEPQSQPPPAGLCGCALMLLSPIFYLLLDADAKFSAALRIFSSSFENTSPSPKYTLAPGSHDFFMSNILERSQLLKLCVPNSSWQNRPGSRNMLLTPRCWFKEIALSSVTAMCHRLLYVSNALLNSGLETVVFGKQNPI